MPNTTITTQRDNNGLIAGRDIQHANLINAGDVFGNYNAIGVGAQVVINQVHRARSQIAELSAEIQLAETQLASAVEYKLTRLLRTVGKATKQNRRNPYKSLLDYQLEDASYFYGRDAAIHELLGKIHNHRLTVLHADSGAGKSSLLQAGIGARILAAGHLPLHLRPFRETPPQRIKRAFLADVETLPELARFQQMSLAGFLQAVSKQLGTSTLYIFLDQFEEFFLELPAAQRTLFVDELADCLEQRELDVRWVLALRKEQFADLAIFQPRISPFVNEYFLPAFALDEAKEVITEPARHFDVYYESPALVDTILTDLQEEDGSLQPPQVQLVCYHLFEETIISDTPELITSALYNQPRGRGFRGAQGILSDHLVSTLARMYAPEARLAGRILETLVSSRTRRIRMTQSELHAALATSHGTTPNAGGSTVDPDHVLTLLVNERLLRLDETEDDEPLYELAHDYLLDEIELDEETLKRKFAQELLNQQVEAWRADNAIRIAPETLAIIERQAQGLQTNDDATTLLRLSREAIGRRRRIVHYSYGAAGAALVMALLLGVLAYLFLRDADNAILDRLIQERQARSVQLANQAQTAGDCDQAWILMREAFTVIGDQSVPVTVDQIGRNLIDRPICGRALSNDLHETMPAQLDYSPDGSRFLTVDFETSNIRVWNAQNYKLLYPIPAPADDILWAEFSPDSRAILVHSLRATDPLALWLPADREPRWVSGGVLGTLSRVEFNRTGDTLLLQDEGGVQLLDAQTGEMRACYTGPTRYAIFSRDMNTSTIFVLTDGALKQLRVDNCHEKELPIETAPIHSTPLQPLFSVDERTLYLAMNGDITRIDLVERQPYPIYESNEEIYEVVYSANGDTIGVRYEGGTYIWQLGGGESTVTKVSTDGTLVQMSDDGAHALIMQGFETDLLLWDIAAARPITIPVAPETEYLTNSGYTFTPDGEQLLQTFFDRNAVYAWSIGSSKSPQAVIGVGSPAVTVAFNHAGTYAATAYADGSVRIWDLEQDQPLHTLRGPNSGGYWLEFSDDDRYLVTANDGGEIAVWDWRTAQSIATFTHNGQFLSSLSISRDANQILTTSDGELWRWDIPTETGQRLLADQLRGHVRFATFGETDTTILSIEGNALSGWDLTTERKEFLIYGDTPFERVISHTNGAYVRTIDEGGLVKDWATGKAPGARHQTVWCCVYDSAYNASFDASGRFLVHKPAFHVDIWDLEQSDRIFQTPSLYNLNGIARHPNGDQLLFALDSGETRQFMLRDEESQPLRTAVKGENIRLTGGEFSPNATYLLTVEGIEDLQSRLWDVASQQEIVLPLPAGLKIQRATFSPSGTVVALIEETQFSERTIYSEWTISLIDIANRRILDRLILSDIQFPWVRFISDERLLFLFDEQAEIWNINTGMVEKEFVTGEQSAVASAISQDGTRIAIALRNGTTTIWDATTADKEPLFRLDDQNTRLSGIRFDPQDRYILTQDIDGRINLWEQESGNLYRTLYGASGIRSLSPLFSPDGAYLLTTGARDNLLRLYTADDFEHYDPLTSHGGRVIDAEFSMDSTNLLTRDANNVVRVWDVATGELRHEFLGNGEFIESVTFAADGKAVLALLRSSTTNLAQQEATLRQWPLYKRDEWINVSTSRIERDIPFLTPREYGEFNIGQMQVAEESSFTEQIVIWLRTLFTSLGER